MRIFQWFETLVLALLVVLAGTLLGTAFVVFVAYLIGASW